jgi:archaetidylinositol phosphate synthase
MASYWIGYCEQVDPVLPKVVRVGKQASSGAMRRQESFTAIVEKRALVWLAERTPAWLNSDHLTLLGFGAQLLAGAGYALAHWNRDALLVVIVALVLNWLGDSLDGTLARYRQQQRPRYGFYVDHMVDSIGALALMGGLAVSGFMHSAIAIALLIGFLLLSIQSYLATYSLGEFRLSFWRFGPTELRILLAIGSIALFFRPIVQIFGKPHRLFDVGGVIGVIGMGVMLIVWTAQNTRKLYNQERIR